ncbi:MAG: hypothetical protein QG650_111 [Patescibacteria group bacterium]|nr:hypothetical protein [Patescibacteria group bacterium]
MDFKQERTSYGKSSYADKRVTVLALLKGLQGKGEVFDTLFGYLIANPEGASEAEMDEVFEIVMQALEADDEEKLQEQMARLSGLQDKIRQMKEKEREEKAAENPEEILMTF